ncbi:hypothetical protein UFOVP860_60 [uncultured Caudovirales phage]|uniref:Uncharacterized protein n=1 Tax=uncultured Caudovirales phage TaxID=2100421 RepID=A0A6J5PD94_9CAUD|nr:hypothetical protein UFOVP860_60 [uncultured Caudovirales phage]CAB4195692.1 hypothetical protein UFOVP1293_51 [uncultured Caudovirales phage]CAB4222574.1 hypothetical protein UFOVP1644_69 [uncultured Caudovirales phage]
MNPDRLTRAERIRLEAFALIGARHRLKPIPMDQHLSEAAALELWLYAAREPMPAKGPQPPTTLHAGK